jgi:hypothetical protein
VQLSDRYFFESSRVVGFETALIVRVNKVNPNGIQSTATGTLFGLVKCEAVGGNA